MQVQRFRERIMVEIAITVTTVLDNLEGTIVDLSEGGARVVGCTLPAGTQCQIDLEGHITFGTVRWSEEDRMGIKFPYELTDGPLYEQLKLARAKRHEPVPFQPRKDVPVPTGPLPGININGFGRRSR